MIVGSTMIHDGVGSEPYLSAPFARGGQAATFTMDVTHLKAATTLTFVATVEHKDRDETVWGSAGAFDGITADGLVSNDVSDLKEQIRFSFTFTAGAFGDIVHVVMGSPSWRTFT